MWYIPKLVQKTGRSLKRPKRKVEILRYNKTCRPRGGLEIQLYSFFDLGARWGLIVKATPSRQLYSRERNMVPITEVSVGIGAGLDGHVKSRPPPGIELQTVQPVATSYTNYALPPAYVAQVILIEGIVTLRNVYGSYYCLHIDEMCSSRVANDSKESAASIFMVQLLSLDCKTLKLLRKVCSFFQSTWDCIAQDSNPRVFSFDSFLEIKTLCFVSRSITSKPTNVSGL